MLYQSKTTMVRFSVMPWTEQTSRTPSECFSAMHAVAVQIAAQCQMDMMSVAPFSIAEKGEECNITVVYVNNGRSLDDICRIMNPEINKRTPKYWMMLDLHVWHGLLECIVTTRVDGEQWD